MFYAKHPTLGNKHFESVDRAAMEADGWRFFPHPEGNLPAYLPIAEIALETPIETAAPDVLVAEKKRPGRPKKAG